MTDFLIKARELEARATKGPWRVTDWRGVSDIIAPGPAVAMKGLTVACRVAQCDKDLIAFARNVWPEILAVIDAAWVYQTDEKAPWLPVYEALRDLNEKANA